MLACTAIQYTALPDVGQHLNRFPPEQYLRAAYAGANVNSDIDFYRTPLLEVDNHNNYARGNKFKPQSMPQTPTSTQQSQDYPLTAEEHVSDTTGHGCGLGIATDENLYPISVPSSGPETDHLYALPRSHSFDPGVHRQLSSPFDEHSYTPAPSWFPTYRQEGTNEGVNPAMQIYPQQHLLRPQNVSMQGSYSMSPGDYAHDEIRYDSVGQSHFKRPYIRQNSASSSIPQGTAYSYGTPSIEASPIQWTPQMTTPVWQDSAQYISTKSSETPNSMNPYAFTANSEFSPQARNASQPVRAIATVPQRRKPHLRPSLSESCVPRTSSPARFRAMSMGQYLQAPAFEDYNSSQLNQQLPLPPLPPSVLIKTPQLRTYTPLPTATPIPSYQTSRSATSTPNRRKKPSSPPPSDFASTNPPYLVPVKQDPTFNGDLYTPRYKRRTPNGRWEGWCGYCQPGRWLDLKNSRYWEDKLRNHGICAKTRMKFAEPDQIRWVTADGSAAPEHGLVSGNNDPFLEQRKREGLCGVCNQWITMDGMRTKARDRAVGWWMHAYKCHDHDKAAERPENGS